MDDKKIKEITKPFSKDEIKKHLKVSSVSMYHTI